MSRLVTFGCSFTQGYQLSNPSKDSWPSQLAKKINRQVVNNASPGSSNLEILEKILSFKFLESDIVVVGWTYCDRDIIFNKILPNKKIGVWIDEEMFKDWLSVHTAYDNTVRSGMYIHHSSLYLESLNVKYYNFWAPPTIFLNATDKFFNRNKCMPKVIGKVHLHKNILKLKDFANDNSHPGPESYRLAAEKLYRIINA